MSMEKCGEILRDISNGNMKIVCGKCITSESNIPYYDSLEQFSAHFLKHIKLLKKICLSEEKLPSPVASDATSADSLKKPEIYDIKFEKSPIDPVDVDDNSSINLDDNNDDIRNADDTATSTDGHHHEDKIEKKLKNMEKKIKKKRIRIRKKQYPCKECDELFPSFSEMKKHAHSIHLTCIQCNKTFTSRATLSAHRSHKHTACYVCESCGQTFNRNKLELHFPCYELIKSIPCPKCDSMFIDKDTLKCHMRRVHTERRFQCNECDKKFKVGYGLRQHYKRCHSTVEREKKRRCLDCDKAFEFPYELAEHVRIRHAGGELLECPVCKKTYARRLQYGHHIRKSHPEYKKT